MKEFLYKEDKNGEVYALDNPEYVKKVQQEKYELFLDQSGIPDFYHNINFEDYKGNKESKEYKEILYYANNCFKEEFNHVSLYIWGIHSSQKTSLACNILKQSIKNGMKVKFILAGSLINKLIKLQGYNRDGEIEKEIKELKSCDIIAVDDIGDIKKSIQWTKSDLITVEWDNFFREVLASKTKIVMTSNSSIDNFKQYFSDSIYELLDRNTHKIYLSETIKKIRQYNVSKVFEGI